MPKEKIQELIEVMLQRTGPVLPLSAFKDFPELPAPQSMRNRMAEGKIPKEWFFKNGRKTLVDMREYLPFWANGFTSYANTGKVGHK